jgi:hypothetical protein
MARSSQIRPLRKAAGWEDRFWRTLETAVPSDVRRHLRTARTEILLAVKSVVDDAAARSAGTPRPVSRATRRAR